MKNKYKNRPISYLSYLFLLFWILLAALSIDGLKMGLINLGKGSPYTGSAYIIAGLLGLGVGSWRVLRYTYRWDLEKGRVKRYLKLLR